MEVRMRPSDFAPVVVACLNFWRPQSVNSGPWSRIAMLFQSEMCFSAVFCSR
jgi:hypothetical protein